MALTRKMLKAMGIEDEKIDQIIEAHTETTDGLKEEAARYKSEADKVPDLQKDLEEAQEAAKAADTGDEYKDKYEEAQRKYEEFKEQVEADKAAAEKASLYRSLLLAAGVDEKRVDAVLKVTDLESVEVEDGKIKGAEELTEGIKSEWSAFIATEGAKGANVANPPETDPAPKEPTSLSEALHQKYDTKE